MDVFIIFLKLKTINFYFIFYVQKCFAYMYVRVPLACMVPQVSKKGSRIPGNGAIDGCESLYEYWKLNLGPLEVQLVL